MGKMKLKNQGGLILILFVIGGYFLINALYYGSSESSITGYGNPSGSSLFLPQLLSQTLYLALATGCIGFIAFCSQIRRFKFFALIIALSFVFMAFAMPLTSVHGRYVDILIPLVLIGALSYKRKGRSNKYLILGFATCLMTLPMLCMFWRDTINSATNIYTLLSVDIIFYSLVLLIIGSFLFVAISRRDKTVHYGFVGVILLLFISGNVMNFQYLDQASDNAFESCKIGKYIDRYDINGLSFDREDVYNANKTWWASYCLICYYNREIIALKNSSEEGYFISSKEISGQVLAKQKHFAAIEEETGQYLYLYRR